MSLFTNIKYKLSIKPITIKDNDDIKIMSFNIRCINKNDKGKKYYKVRMPLIRKLLEEENPDIVGFQEVRVRQFYYLLKILKNYDYEYQKRDHKPDGEANPVFYKKNRFKCLNKSTFWLSDTYKIMSNTFNGNCFRICSYVKLLDLKSNKELYVFNTHLDHKVEEARIKGILLIKKIIEELSIKPSYLIMGDMNDFYNSKTINELFKELIDASKFNNKEDIETFHDYGRNAIKIDYIALSKDIIQTNYDVIKKTYNKIYPSDHYPIEISIKLN